MRNTQRWRNQWTSALKVNFLLLHPSGERSPSFPRPFIPNIEDGKTSQTFKVVCSGICVYIRDITPHANSLRAINFIIIPLTFVLIHSSHAKTFLTVCGLYMKRISPDWSVSGFLGQSRFLRQILMWCDEMRCYPLLFYSSFRCASHCCATAAPPLAHVIAKQLSFALTWICFVRVVYSYLNPMQ